MANLNIQNSRPAEGVVFIEAEGEVTKFNSGHFLECMMEALKEDFGHVIVSLESLKFIESGGLRALIALNKKARDHCARLAIVCNNPLVKRVFALAGLSNYFQFSDSVKNSLEEFTRENAGKETVAPKMRFVAERVYRNGMNSTGIHVPVVSRIPLDAAAGFGW